MAAGVQISFTEGVLFNEGFTYKIRTKVKQYSNLKKKKKLKYSIYFYFTSILQLHLYIWMKHDFIY
jgi:hypothetical protein